MQINTLVMLALFMLGILLKLNSPLRHLAACGGKNEIEQ
jgi:hypothetical protein